MPAQSFRGDERFLTYLVEVGRDFSVIPNTSGCLLLAMNAVTPRVIARDLVYEPARDFFARHCFTSPWCMVVRRSAKQRNGLCQSVGVNSCPRHTVFGNGK